MSSATSAATSSLAGKYQSASLKEAVGQLQALTGGVRTQPDSAPASRLKGTAPAWLAGLSFPPIPRYATPASRGE